MAPHRDGRQGSNTLCRGTGGSGAEEVDFISDLCRAPEGAGFNYRTQLVSEPWLHTIKLQIPHLEETSLSSKPTRPQIDLSGEEEELNQ